MNIEQLRGLAISSHFFRNPPMAITPLPVGDVTNAGYFNSYGRFGPEICMPDDEFEFILGKCTSE